MEIAMTTNIQCCVLLQQQHIVSWISSLEPLTKTVLYSEHKHEHHVQFILKCNDQQLMCWRCLRLNHVTFVDIKCIRFVFNMLSFMMTNKLSVIASNAKSKRKKCILLWKHVYTRTHWHNLRLNFYDCLGSFINDLFSFFFLFVQTLFYVHCQELKPTFCVQFAIFLVIAFLFSQWPLQIVFNWCKIWNESEQRNRKKGFTFRHCWVNYIRYFNPRQRLMVLLLWTVGNEVTKWRK